MTNDLVSWAGQLMLGLVQGLTEVLPISSSGHLAIGQAVWADFAGQGNVTLSTAVLVHLGTFFAILVLYWRDVFILLRSACDTVMHSTPRGNESPTARHPLGQRTPFYMLLSIALTAVCGLLLHTLAAEVFGDPALAAGLIAVNGVCLLIAGAYVASRPLAVRDIVDLGWQHYLLIGAAQGLGVIPGLSRFGLVLIAGLLCGLAWHQALRLSFLLSLPAVLGALALDLYQYGGAPPGVHPGLAAAAAVMLAGLAASFAIRVVRREDLHAQQALTRFGFYCVAAGPFYFLYLRCLA